MAAMSWRIPPPIAADNGGMSSGDALNSPMMKTGSGGCSEMSSKMPWARRLVFARSSGLDALPLQPYAV
eukprot:10627895-Alexandrium_andersonii.AAC.1